jgi:hypothetical protein
MDSQFNSLLQSYSSNFVQHKVTGNPSYQQSFLAAKQGLDEILSGLEQDVSAEKQQIADFYKSGVEQKMTELQQNNRKLQRGIMKEKDEEIASKTRSEHPPSIQAQLQITTAQYVSIGVLGVIAMGLSML